ncbi:MAG TPA: DUF6445 family protein [Allosphingosinicella sp.]|jgi:hypothetical protein
MSGRIVNPRAAVEIVRQGLERQPVIVIDDMLVEPDQWRQVAARARSGPIRPFHPGVSTPVPARLAGQLRDELEPLIGETFGLDPVPPASSCFLSLVTTRPEALVPVQRLPHVDGLERERIAILVYLAGTEKGGTAFFRQRSTGFETVDSGRLDAFQAALDAGLAEHGEPPAGYLADDSELYDRIALYEARPNRGLVYRSHSLHSAAIVPGAELAEDPGTGRLTLNAFLSPAVPRVNRPAQPPPG